MRGAETLFLNQLLSPKFPPQLIEISGLLKVSVEVSVKKANPK
jgi:hypothetical protein